MELGKLAKDSSIYLLGSLATRAVGIIMTPIYTRFLTPAEYGTVELLELCTQVVVIAVGIQAIGDSMVRVYHDYRDEDSRRAVISTALLNTTIIGGLVTGLACLGAPALTRWIFHSTQHPILVRVAFVAM